MHVFIIKTDPDPKKNKRSFKVTVDSVWSYPDEDWTVPYDFTEEEPDVWRLTPKADLVPGEYGLFDGQLYDFGVDK